MIVGGVGELEYSKGRARMSGLLLPIHSRPSSYPYPFVSIAALPLLEEIEPKKENSLVQHRKISLQALFLSTHYIRWA